MVLRLGVFSGRNLADVSVGLLLLAKIEIRAERAHARPRLHLDVHQIFDKETRDRRNSLFLLKHFIRRRPQSNRVAVWQSHRPITPSNPRNANTLLARNFCSLSYMPMSPAGQGEVI